MNAIIESLTGMDKLSDQVIATDFLLTAKNGVRNYSMVITEANSPEVKDVLRRQLDDAIAAYDAISDYMIRHGYYHPYNPQEQYKVDMKVTDTALNLADNFI